MRRVPTLKYQNLAHFQLQNGQRQPLGLSSYRNTFANRFMTLTNQSAQALSDEAWLSLMGNYLTEWFLFERLILDPSSPCLLGLLHSKGCIKLDDELKVLFSVNKDLL